MGSHRVILSRSQPKQSKKRKRNGESQVSTLQLDHEIPQTPPARSHVLMGFNKVTRHLEKLSLLSAKKADLDARAPNEALEEGFRHVIAVFLFRTMDDLIFSHLPTMCFTASLARPSMQPTRLVLLDSSVGKRVLEAVRQPISLSVLAVLDGGEENMPDLKALEDYVREHVEPVDVPWLRDVVKGTWLGTKISSD